jgi:hypothetical protein
MTFTTIGDSNWKEGMITVDHLMTIEDIAAMWKVTREHARRYLVRLPEFPDPAPGSTRKNQRWKTEDVRAFLNGNQGRS